MTSYIVVSLLLVFSISFAAHAQFFPPPPVASDNPIVLVPGIGASWNWDDMLGSLYLDNWNFVIGVHTYDNLIKKLETKRDVYVAFYDWRDPIEDSSFEYLKATINKAKLESGKDKVDIVAHSMGGLLARSYIQSDLYGNDVENLVTLGTPNLGSSDMYTVWEGGRIPENWNKSSYWKGYANADCFSCNS